MFFSFAKSSANYPFCFFIDDDLGFKCMAFFLARIMLFLLFLGLSIGLSVASIAESIINDYT